MGYFGSFLLVFKTAVATSVQGRRHRKKFYSQSLPNKQFFPPINVITNTMDSTNFNGTSEKFLQWFKSLPGATFSDDIKIVDLRDRNAGRGISK